MLCAPLCPPCSYMFAIAIVPPLAWLVVPIAKMFPDKPLVRVRKVGHRIHTHTDTHTHTQRHTHRHKGGQKKTMS